MSKVRQASAVLLSAALSVPLFGVAPASAAPVTEPAAAAGYFSATGVPDTGTPAGKPPNVTADADGVAPGNLAVAGGQGAEQKVSFLFFALEAFAPGGSITKAQLTVPLVPSDDENVVIAADPVKVRACLAGPEGFGGEHGESITVAPARLCEDAQAPAKLSADGKAYVFDVSTIAAAWTTANDGLALTTAEGASSTPFQVVFAPGEQATLAYETTAPAAVSVPELPALPSTDFGAVSGGSTDLSGGFGGETLPTVDSGSFGSVEAPVVSGGEPAPAPQAAPAAPQIAVTPAASGAALGESMRPTSAFWLAALLLAAGLALLSLIMGDPRVPQAVARQSKLTQSLQARERGSARSGLSRRPLTA